MIALRAFSLGLIAMLAASPTRAAEACASADLTADPSIKPDWKTYADDLVNDDGLLWRLEKPGRAPSYVFATWNLAHERAVVVAARAAPYVKSAAAVATEFDTTDVKARTQAQAEFMSDARDPGRDVLAGVIEGADVDRLSAVLAPRGVASEAIHHLKPWFLMTKMVWPLCEWEKVNQRQPTAVAYLANVATTSGVPLMGLISIGEFEKAIETVPDADATAVLKLVMRSDKFNADAYATLLSLYEQGRNGALRAYVDAQPEKTDSERQASRNVRKILITDFNATLAERAAPLLEKGGAFLSVGPPHLSGANGLIERFRAMGYVVSKVW